jgi:hypothetical protein
MNWQGNLIVWGSLVIVLVCLFAGVWFLIKGLIAVGIVLGVAWVILVFQLAIAMNSDI